MAQAPGRFWVIRYPASGSPKSVVAQFDTAGETEIPGEIVEYDGFQIQAVSGRSDLVGNVDQSGLSDHEQELLSVVYPIVND